MSKDSTKNTEESLFLSAMSDVTPLKPHNKVNKRKKPSSARSSGAKTEHEQLIDDVFSDAEILQDCPEILSYSRGGLQHSVMKKLRLGRFPIEDILDLHGLNVEKARNRLLSFLQHCEADGLRHVLLIHGKGFRSADGAVIKPMVNRWLRQTDKVLAFHTAQPADGGTGAVYVLLKKPA